MSTSSLPHAASLLKPTSLEKRIVILLRDVPSNADEYNPLQSCFPHSPTLDLDRSEAAQTDVRTRLGHTLRPLIPYDQLVAVTGEARGVRNKMHGLYSIGMEAHLGGGSQPFFQGCRLSGGDAA